MCWLGRVGSSGYEPATTVLVCDDWSGPGRERPGQRRCRVLRRPVSWWVVRLGGFDMDLTRRPIEDSQFGGIGDTRSLLAAAELKPSGDVRIRSGTGSPLLTFTPCEGVEMTLSC
jgi:hypothetical protein